MESTEEMGDCTICLSPYTNTLRKQIKCPFCPLVSCLTCVKRYMLESVQDPHCMGCKRAWNRDFIDAATTIAWRRGDLKKHREDMLVDREKARLPLLQPRIEARVQAEEMSATIAAENKRCHQMEIQVATMRENVLRLHRRQQRLFGVANGTVAPADLDGPGEKKEVRAFTQKCPAEDCRGFLSSQWKCGTCQVWVCPDCCVPKGRDKDSPHTCDEGQKATAQLIRKETRPCPKCGEGISKVDGCFARDTPVLLWDGTEKMSQDIKVGDTLIGDDGNPRIVQEVCSGEDELYEVKQTNGMTYTVNSKHKLALKFSGETTIYESPNIYKMRWFDVPTLSMKTKTIRYTDGEKEKALDAMLEVKKTLSLPDVIELTVDDYLTLPESTIRNLMGFKSAGVHWSKKDVRLDPYLIGLYLGDGIVDGISYAIYPQKDPEILQFILDWCEKNDCEVVHDNAYRFRVRRSGAEQGRLAIQHGATSADCKGCAELHCDFCDLPSMPSRDVATIAAKNPLKSALDSYSLLKNKHIPADYMINDRDTRLQVLAGLIDTDGYLGNDGKRIQLPQANHALARQIEFLARSLGFVVNVTTLEKKNITFPGGAAKDYSDQLCVNISGERLCDIPCRVARKKCCSSAQNKDGLRTSIEVKSVGRGAYYGWSLDGNKRFVSKDFTTLRNCDQMWCITCKTPFSWTTGKLVFGVVHNPHYYQWLRQQNGGEAPRVAGDVPCGGLVGFYSLQRNPTIPKKYMREIENIHRVTAELHDGILRQYPRLDEIPDNGDLGIEYTLKRITMEHWKKELWNRETKREKGLDLRGPLDLFVNVSSEVLRQMAAQMTPEEFMNLLGQLRTLRGYVNDEIEKIGKRYSCMVPKITNCWHWDAHGGNRKEIAESRNYHEHILVLKQDLVDSLPQDRRDALTKIVGYGIEMPNDADGNKRIALEHIYFDGNTKDTQKILKMFDYDTQIWLAHHAREDAARAAAARPAEAASVGSGGSSV